LLIAKDGRCFVDTSEVTTSNTLLSTVGLTTAGQRTINEKSLRSSGPPNLVADETVHKEKGDRMKRAATTTSSLEAEQSDMGRMIKEIDQDDEIALDDDAQGRKNDDEMFGVDDLSREEVVLDTIIVTTVADKVSAAPITDVIEDEITMAQALATLRSTKPKVVVQEQEVSTTIPAAATTATTIVPTLGVKAEEQEAARLSRAQQDEEANISWDNTQAMMEANNLLAERLQAREREEFFKVQKARLLVEPIEKRKKHFNALRAQEKRNKPLIKAQIRKMRKVNDFIAMDSEAQKSIGKEAQESSTKRTTKSLESDISKKQKVDKNVKPVIDDTEELKKCMEIVPDDGDEVLVEATPLSSRSPTIIDYKIHKEGKKTYFKIIKANSNSQVYQTFEKMI
nr:hypothetical protein [Tanacetum cinerariifolium]